MNETNFKDTVIEVFAKKIATTQERADEVYYKNDPPREVDINLSSFILGEVEAIKSIAIELGISTEVYTAAYEIYDFRNSGRTGYTRVDGKIVKVEDQV